MRTISLALLLLLASPLCAQAEVEQLQRQAAELRAQIAALKQLGPVKNAGEDEPALMTRLKEHCFAWSSADGKFALRLETLVLFRYAYHDVRASGGKGPSADNGRDFHNLRLPYMRVQLAGHLLSPTLRFNVELVPADDFGGFGFDELWFRWEPIPLFNLTVGQQRSPYTFENMVERSRRAFVEPSMVDKAFDQGFTKGITVSGVADFWGARVFRWDVGVYNGVLGPRARSGIATLDVVGSHAEGVKVNNVSGAENLEGGFRNSDREVLGDSFNELVDADLMFNARIELHPMGEVARRMSDSRGGEEAKDWQFMVGSAVNYFNARVSGMGTFLGNFYHTRQSAALPITIGSGRHFIQAETLAVTVDGHFRGFGFFVNWSLHYRKVEFHSHGRLQNSGLVGRYFVSQAEDKAATVDFGYHVEAIDTVIGTRVGTVNYDEFGSTSLSGQPVDGDSFGPDSVEYGWCACWEIHGDSLKLTFDYRYVVQQMPHGVAKGKDSTQGVERISEYRNFHEFRIQLQWIF